MASNAWKRPGQGESEWVEHSHNGRNGKFFWNLKMVTVQISFHDESGLKIVDFSPTPQWNGISG